MRSRRHAHDCGHTVLGLHVGSTAARRRISRRIGLVDAADLACRLRHIELVAGKQPTVTDYAG